MPKFANCPSCQSKLALPEGPARRILCPKCGNKFEIEALGGAAAPPPSGTAQPVRPPASKPALQSFDDAPLPAEPPRRPTSSTQRGNPVPPAAPARSSRRVEPVASDSPFGDLETLRDHEDTESAPTLPPRPSTSGNYRRPAAAATGARGTAGAPAPSNVGPLRIGIGVAALAVSLGAIGFVLKEKFKNAEENNKIARALEEGANPLPGNAQFRDPAKPGPTPPAATVKPVATVASSVPPAVVSSPSSSPPPIASAPTAPGQERSGDQIVADLKDATVYIKLKVGGRTISTGTGYAIESDPKGTVWVATNRHVATLDLEELPDGLVEKGAVPELEVVFRSGQPGKEQAVAAQLAAADSSEEVENDIAFLLTRNVTNPPRPILLDGAIEPNESMSYIGGGFPLGGLVNRISHSEGNPSITITRGGVAAVRRDDRFGHIKLIQVDGSLQPGNSGGPLVDAKTGRLIGMAVAKASSADTIGFLVPAANVRRALRGTVGRALYIVNSVSPGGADLTIQAELMDPREQIRGVLVHVAPLGSVSAFGPKPDGSWDPLPGTSPVQMQLAKSPDQKPAAVGRFQAQFQGNSRKVLVQTGHLDDAGMPVYDAPRTLDVPEKPGPILPPNSIQRLVERMFRKSLAKLSPLLDPEQDCHLTKDEESGTIKLSIPPKLHVLAPEVRKEKKPVNNAPMSLIDVKGDFAALVAVVGDMNPGAEPLDLPQGVTFRTTNGQTKRKAPGTFQGAGLLLYQDGNNYLRLERASFTMDGKPLLQQKILIEIVKKGQHLIEPIYLPVPEHEMMLGIARRKGRISCIIVVGDSLALGTKELILDFNDDVKIGLCASNVSQKPLEAQFKGFVLVDDKAKIDAALGFDDKKDQN